MILEIGTALAIGAYVVLSRDAQPKRLDATPRESLQHPADPLPKVALRGRWRMLASSRCVPTLRRPCN